MTRTANLKARELEGLAAALERETVVKNLLTALVPGRPSQDDDERRFGALAEAFESDEKTKQSLLGDAPLAQAAALWRRVSALRNPAHYHALAIILREEGLRRALETQEPADPLAAASLLFSLLFSSPKFRADFCKQRVFAEPATQRVDLPSRDATGLFERCLKDFFELHRTMGERDFAEKADIRARVHLALLTTCASGGDEPKRLLASYSFDFPFDMERDMAEQTRQLARASLDRWIDVVLQDADKALADPAAIAREKKLSKHFVGAIDHVERFLKLGVDNERLANSVLDWYNDWCFELHALKDEGALRKVCSKAEPAATRLKRFAKKGAGHLPANQAISKHCLIQGALEEAERDVPIFREALEWNPGNHNAQQLLGQAEEALKSRLFVSQVNRGVEAANNGQLDVAERELRKAQGMASNAEQYEIASNNLATVLSLRRQRGW
jgi:hypothetical protein